MSLSKSGRSGHRRKPKAQYHARACRTGARGCAAPQGINQPPRAHARVCRVIAPYTKP